MLISTNAGLVLIILNRNAQKSSLSTEVPPPIDTCAWRVVSKIPGVKVCSDGRKAEVDQ